MVPLVLYYLLCDLLETQYHLSKVDAQGVPWLIIGLVGIGVVAVWARSQVEDEVWARKKKGWDDEAQRRIEVKYALELARLDEQIRSTAARISELKAEMDHLVRSI